MNTLLKLFRFLAGLFLKKLLRILNRVKLISLQVRTNSYIGRDVSVLPLSLLTFSRLKVGGEVEISNGTILQCGSRKKGVHKGAIEIGSRTRIGLNCILFGEGEIHIGNDVIIAPGTIITSVGHLFEDTGTLIKDQHLHLAKVIIEDDVWIGANCSILPGVTIGKGSVIGAGAVVTNNIPHFSVAVGVPAKVIRNRQLIKPT